MKLRDSWLDSLLLAVWTAVLIWPLFQLEYLDNWPSIESTFIADARMLREHLPHPGWQPFWYAGTRFDYIYPPALRYGTALLSKFAGISTARSYHIYTASFYVLGIVAVYWLVRVGTGAGSGSRIGSLLAAAGTALLSPSFLLLPTIRHDSPFRIPQRLHVLMLYGEGPHISALCVLPAALALSFIALRKWTPAALAGASVLCALTVSTNFYGATALAIFFPIVAWSIWVTQRDKAVLYRAVGIGALAYALCAFWLTPSYLKITAINLQWVALPGNTRSRLIALMAVALFCIVSRRWSQWRIFVIGSAFFLSLDVLGYFYLGFRVAGDSARLIPELDLALLLVFFEVIRALGSRGSTGRIAALIACLVAFYPAARYLKHAYSPFPKSPPLATEYDYQIARVVHDHLPGQRVLAPGTVRFWFDAWFDNSQLDGGSSQGMINQLLPVAEWQIFRAPDRADIALLWLEALGTDAVVVPGKMSREFYHDYENPDKFRGVAAILADDGHGTTIYAVPRRYGGIGRVVETAKLGAVGKVQGGDDVNTLKQYVAVVDSPGQNPTQVAWRGFDEMDVDAQISQGESLLLQETYDAAWGAYENGRAVPLRIEPVMNFMLLDLPEGHHNIQMRFESPLENRIGQFVSGLGLILVLVLLFLQPHSYRKRG